MTTLQQAFHVLRKDLRHIRFTLAGYVVLLCFGASGVLGRETNFPGLFSALGALLAALVMATAVQDDDALSSQALWRVRPLTPTSIAGAKLLMLGVLFATGLTVQFLAALAFDASPTQLRMMVGRALPLGTAWMCVTLIAASTPDLKRFLLVLILAPVAVVLLAVETLGRLASGFDESWVRVALASSVTAVAIPTIGAVFLVLVYLRRVHRVVAWSAAGLVLYLLAWRSLSISVSDESTEQLPTDTAGPTVRPTLEAAIGFAADKTPILQLSVSGGGDRASTERIVLEYGTATLRFADGHTRKVPLMNPQRAPLTESPDGRVRSESVIWGRSNMVLQQPSRLSSPASPWPHLDRVRTRFSIDTLTAAERTEIDTGTVTVRVDGSAIAFVPRPATIVPLRSYRWSAVDGIRAWVRDTSVGNARAIEISVQSVPGASRVDDALATAFRNNAPDVVLLNLRTSQVLSTRWHEQIGDDFPLVLPGVSVTSRRFELSSRDGEVPTSSAAGAPLQLGGDPIGVGIIGWQLRYRVAVEVEPMNVIRLRDVIVPAPIGSEIVSRALVR